MEREAGELFSVAETVPAASPRCFATVFNVIFLFSRRAPVCFFCVGVIETPSTISRSARIALLHPLDRFLLRSAVFHSAASIAGSGPNPLSQRPRTFARGKGPLR